MIANAMGVLTVIFNNFIDIEKTNMHTLIYNKLSQGDITHLYDYLVICAVQSLVFYVVLRGSFSILFTTYVLRLPLWYL
jgi:hypothetical protein